MIERIKKKKTYQQHRISGRSYPPRRIVRIIREKKSDDAHSAAGFLDEELRAVGFRAAGFSSVVAGVGIVSSGDACSRTSVSTLNRDNVGREEEEEEPREGEPDASKGNKEEEGNGPRAG